jgi:hypothetical protein
MPRQARLNDLPNELLISVFEELELPWLFIISRSCKRFRWLIKTREFGHRYLKQDVRNLSFEVRIKVYVGWMDEFDFGKTFDSFFILHTKGQGSSELHSFQISPLGVPGYSHSSLPEQTACSRRRKETNLESDPIAASETHRRKCKFCQEHKWDSFEYFIDKKYVVFLQTFTDHLDFKLRNGASIQLSLVHNPSMAEDRLRWNSNDDLYASNNPAIEIKRYDLLESPEKSRRLQVFFDLMPPSPDDLEFLLEKTTLFEHEPQPKLYNPYQ